MEIIFTMIFQDNVFFGKREIKGIDVCWILFRSDSRMSLRNVLIWEKKSQRNVW